MATLVLTDPLFIAHDPGPGHPERPARLATTLELLETVPIDRLVVQTPREATFEEMAAAHETTLIHALEQLDGKRARIDEDTATSPESWRAAKLAAGAAVQAVETVWNGSVENAFGLVRPPGHHATPVTAMGFCLINNVAVAACAARRLGAERVLVLDWDVHHGNGTQDCFYARSDVLYQSVHQYPFYPGTGAAHDIGSGGGEGFTVNCPLPGGQGDGDYAAVFHDLLIPIAREFQPQIVLVSAGFDPHEDDPLGGMRVTERGFAMMCSLTQQLAKETCGGKLVLLLEGGYSLPGLSRSVHACLEVMTGRSEDLAPSAGSATGAVIREVKSALKNHWAAARG